MGAANLLTQEELEAQVPSPSREVIREPGRLGHDGSLPVRVDRAAEEVWPGLPVPGSDRRFVGCPVWVGGVRPVAPVGLMLAQPAETNELGSITVILPA